METKSEADYVWRRPNAFLDHFMLKANGENYAYLRFLDQNKLLAELEVDLEQLVFVDNGSSRSVIDIYYAGSDQSAKPILSYESHLQGTGGYFWLSNGYRLGWQPSRRTGEWTQRRRMHERPSARPLGSPRSDLRCTNSGWHTSYSLLDQDGTTLVRFGTNGTMVLLREPRAWTTWIELLAILALGWLLIRMDIYGCKRYAI